MIDYKSLEEHIKNYFDASLDIDRCTYIIAINKDKAALESLKSHFLNPQANFLHFCLFLDKCQHMFCASTGNCL